MRVNRETLLKVAKDTALSRARQSHDLVAAYLCGTLLGEEYLLGGAADIDLVLIHAGSPPITREIQPLTSELHLDIAHHAQSEYMQPRQLRLHPWLGPTIMSCLILHDPQHFMDFVQASVRGQFDRPDYVMERARQQAEHARSIWQHYHTAPPHPVPQDVLSYLKALAHAANAIASLNGPPLVERRFFLDFPARAQAVGRPGLWRGLLGLLGAAELDAAALSSWLPFWQAACQSLPADQLPPRLHPDRRLYYSQAFNAILDSEFPQAVSWPLLLTWTMAAAHLPEASPARADWFQACALLGLVGQGFSEKIAAFDAYLDLIDEILEAWAVQNGAN